MAANLNQKYYIEDYVGTTVNSWTVIEYSFRRKGRNYWLCRCVCGTIKSIHVHNLVTGRSKSCNQGKCCLGPRNFRHTQGEFDPYLSFPGYKFKSALEGAIKRDLVWTVTQQEASDILEAQEFKCALSGLPIKYSMTRKGESTASYDRIDSSKGYIVGNVQFVHKIINSMKSNLSEEQFIQFCIAVAKNNRIYPTN